MKPHFRPNINRMIARRNVRGLARLTSLWFYDAVRFDAAVALGQVGDKRAVGALIRALKPRENVTNWFIMWFYDPLVNVPAVAALALGHIGDMRAVEPLIHMLKYGKQELMGGGQEAAAKALGEIGAHLEDAALRAHTVEALIPRVDKYNCEIGRIAAWSLVQIGAPAVEPLIKLLQPEYKPMHYGVQGAVITLGQIGAQLEDASLLGHIVEELAAVLAKKGVLMIDLYLAAAEALGQIGVKVEEPALRGRIIDVLVAAREIRNYENMVRNTAEASLAELGWKPGQ